MADVAHVSGISNQFVIGAPASLFTGPLPTVAAARLITVAIVIPGTTNQVAAGGVVLHTARTVFTKVASRVINSIDLEVWALYTSGSVSDTLDITITNGPVSIGFAYYSDTWSGTATTVGGAIEAATFTDHGSTSSSPISASVTTITDRALVVADFGVNSNSNLGSGIGTGYTTAGQGTAAGGSGYLIQQMYATAVTTPAGSTAATWPFTGTQQPGTSLIMSLAPPAGAGGTNHWLSLMGVGT